MRFTYLIFLILAFWSTLSAQDSDWFAAPTPDGEYAPNEFIVRFNGGYPGGANNLKSDLSAYYGVSFSTRQINFAATDYLVRYPGGCLVPRDESSEEAPLCTICEIIGNPGGGGPLGNVDAAWPNYVVGSGTPEVLEHDPTSIIPILPLDNPFPSGEFDPLLYCSGSDNLPYPNIAGDKSVKIAILDTGIDPSNYGTAFGATVDPSQDHFVSWRPVWSPLGYDETYPLEGDLHGHGTAVGFLAVFEFVNRGAQSQIALYSYRVLDKSGKGYLADALRAIDQAIFDDVNIVNMSFGFRELDCDNKTDELLSIYMQQPKADEKLFLTSAGNDGNNLDITPQWPALENDYPNLIKVAAERCGSTHLWDHSNYSPNLVNISAPGQRIVVPFVLSETQGGYIAADGTSFATPIVASVAAIALTKVGLENLLCRIVSIDGPSTDADPVILNGSLFRLDDCTTTPGGGGTEVEVESEDIPGDGNGSQDYFSSGYVFPNPFGNSITVTTDVSNQVEARIAIYNNQGKVVWQQTTDTEKTEINTSLFYPGVYFLRIVDARGSRTQKIIKN